MTYPGTTIYTDGSKYRSGAACFAVLILCNDKFLCELTKAINDTTVSAGQMEIEAICSAISWVAEHPDEAQPPYRLFTDHLTFISQYNREDRSARALDRSVGRAIKKGREMGLELIHIPAHSQKHNGNKICDITCRALSGITRRDGVRALSLFTGKAVITDESSF